MQCVIPIHMNDPKKNMFLCIISLEIDCSTRKKIINSVNRTEKIKAKNSTFIIYFNNFVKASNKIVKQDFV